MKNLMEIYSKLESCDFNVSTDTRKDIKGSVFFAIKGENFDGNIYVKEALDKGAIAVVTQSRIYKGKNIFVVKDTLKTLQDIATQYRESFKIPIIAIGGSNGKTTSKELTSNVLRKEYKVHSTLGSFNNHLGVPLSILSMQRDTEIGVFEIGANHTNEHTELLNILKPTFVVVTNNGLDHLEGFGSPNGSRKGNAEIYKWAKLNKVEVFVNKKHKDLMQDSRGNKTILYPKEKIEFTHATPLVLKYKNKLYKTHLAGEYNLENIDLAVAIGETFGIKITNSLNIIKKYEPTLKRSQIMKIKSNTFVIDCYNANPTSMKLSLESFYKSSKNPRGVILGEMLELGKYSKNEHKKVINYLFTKKAELVLLVGEEYKKIINNKMENVVWFPNSTKASEWFKKQDYKKYTFLLKGSRGSKIEEVIE